MNSYQKAFKTYKTNKVWSTKVFKLTFEKLQPFSFCKNCYVYYLQSELFIFIYLQMNIMCLDHIHLKLPQILSDFSAISPSQLHVFLLSNSQQLWLLAWGLQNIKPVNTPAQIWRGFTRCHPYLRSYWPLMATGRKKLLYSSVVWFMIDRWLCSCAWHPIAMHTLAVQIELIGL